MRETLEALSGGGFVILVFLAMTVAEVARPWRPTTNLAAARWIGNLALWAVVIGLDLLIAPALAHVTAWLTAIRPPWSLPLWAQIAFGMPALDALTYGMHRAFHASDLLWRVHALHHTDPELDVTTTVRHHPAEWVIMVLAVTAVGTVAGLSPIIIAIFGALNLSIQFFNHANTALPPRLAAILGRFVVTPELHRIHHSRQVRDAATSYGMILSIWDRLFGTFRTEPELGSERIEFGLNEFRDRRSQRVDRMLWQPFLVRRI